MNSFTRRILISQMRRQCWYEFYKWSTQHVWHNFSTYHVNKTKIERDSNLLENLSCIHLTCYVCFSIYLGAYVLSQWGAYSFYVSAFLSYSRHSRPLLRAKDDAANQEYVHHMPWSLVDWRAMLRDKIALIVRMVQPTFLWSLMVRVSCIISQIWWLLMGKPCK